MPFASGPAPGVLPTIFGIIWLVEASPLYLPLSSCVFPVCVSVQISHFYMDTGHMWLGITLI